MLDKYFKKIHVKLCRKYGDIYRVKKILYYDSIVENKVRFAGRTYKLDQTIPYHVNEKGKMIYRFDIDTGKQLSTFEIDSLNPEDLDLFVSRNWISEILASTDPRGLPVEQKIMWCIVGAGVTGFILMILIALGIL